MKEGIEMKKTAIFAGGCFWCMVKPFDHYSGVLSVEAGYTGGHVKNPTYEQVCSGTTGHFEAVRITYEDTLISYSELLWIFWQQIDPTDADGQFFDRGESYQTAIFYQNELERDMAIESKEKLQQSGRFQDPIATQIKPAQEFFVAEDYHQQYYQTHPFHYYRYAKGSGRLDFIKKTWSGSKKSLKHLSPLQLKVTQEAATEPPFRNEFWNHFEEGIYVDIIDGTPLFSSKDKFDSSCGWPSFSRPLRDVHIVEHTDESHGMQRIEVKSQFSSSHLGHVFDDGPQDQGGLRYCINSASLRFIPKEKMAEQGYGELLRLFDKRD